MSDVTTATRVTPASIQAFRVPVFAAAYGISIATVYRLLASRELRGVKVGGRTVILRRDALAWEQSLPRSEHVKMAPRNPPPQAAA
jgi:excisionase family DNA binding protein